MVDRNASRSAVIIAHQQLNYCALSTTRLSNNRVYFFVQKFNRDILEYLIRLVLVLLVYFEIFESYVVQRDFLDLFNFDISFVFH